MSEVTPDVTYFVANPSWFMAMNRFYEYDGKKFLVEDESPNKRRDILPVEFFNHQLMEYDPKCDDDILKLAVKYGIPRLSKRGYFDDFERHNDDYYHRRNSIVLSETATNDYYEKVYVIELKKALENKSRLPNDPRGEWVFIEEARYALTDLQNCTRSLFSWLQSNEKNARWEYMGYVNNSARTKEIRQGSAYQIKEHRYINQEIDPFNYSNLTEAVCTQILDTLVSVAEDGRSWHVCKACGKWFVRFQPKEGTIPKSKKAPNRSEYCCIKCKNSQTQKDFKKRKEENDTQK